MENTPFRYDIEGLVKEIGVDLATIADLYLEYFFEMKGNVQDCKTLCNEKNWYQLKRIIHNMKGISVSLNITDIYNTSVDLDNQLRNEKTDLASEYIGQINELLGCCESDIRGFFKQNGITI